jgi:phosphonate transport system substrate-binding protein
MNPRRRGLLLLPLSFWAPSAWAQQQGKPLTIGLFPNLSPHALLGMYQPLRLFLEESLRRPVELKTAPDFPTFTQRLLEREYDLAVAAPHLARLAQVDAGYIPLFSYRTTLRGILLVPKESSYRRIEELRGKRVAFPDALALMTMMGEEMLKQAGLQPGREVTSIEARSHNNAVRMALAGQVDAAMVGSQTFAGLPQEQRSQLRVLAGTDSLPSQYIIVNPGMGRPEMAQLVSALLRFSVSSSGGEFFRQSGLGGMFSASGGDLRALDPYVDRVRQSVTGR